VCLAVGASRSALAQVAFDFSYSGPGISASGILIATSEANGEYLVTGISGERNGQTITGMAGAGTFASNDNQIYYPATTQTLYGTGGIAFLDIGGFSYMVGNLSYNVGWVNSSNGYTGSPNPFIPGYGEASGGGAAAETVALDGFSLSPAMGAPGPVPGGGLLSGAFLCFGVARSLWRRRRRGPMALEPHIRADGNGQTQTEGPGFSA
jgi:hypothetical protein